MKILVFLLFVSWVRAVPPTMTPVAEVKLVNENDISFRGMELYNFAPSCTGGSGSYTFKYSFDPASTTNVLDAQSDGKIVMLSNAMLDYEAEKQYNAWATCIDSGTSEVSREQGAFSLVLKNVNEPPVCNCSTKTLEINEQTTSNFIIPIDNGISVTDPDNDQLLWTVLPCSGKDYFSITPSKGSPATITITTKVPIDYELTAVSSMPCKELIVKAEDGGGMAVTASVTICCKDSNDNTPIFNPSSYIVRDVNTSADTGTTLTTLTASDADATAGNQIKMFEVSASSPAHQYLNFSGSSLQIKKAVDVQWQDGFTVICLAIDKGIPARTGTATVTLYTRKGDQTGVDPNDPNGSINKDGGGDRISNASRPTILSIATLVFYLSR